MELRELNRWDVSPSEAEAIQRELAPLVITTGNPTEVHWVAGVDVALPENLARAAVVVDEYPGLTPVETELADAPLVFPYVPGYLSFREAPAIIAALRKVTTRPDLVIVDGQGIAHPRGMGIATHIGLLLDLPTIGCAKSLLVGRHGPLGNDRGNWAPIEYRHQVIGAAVRTRPGVTPVYVSIGHRIGLDSAIDWILNCTSRYRLPEPQRQAHRAAGSA
jgi:deoxyribonuclease V